MKDNLLSRRDWLKLAAASVAGSALFDGSVEASDKLLPKPEGSHRVLTCNILLDLPEQKEKQSWEGFRKALCFKVIKARNPDIICLQEVGKSQNREFIKAFPGFKSIGFADAATDRNPPRFRAIRNVILFSKNRYEMVSAGSYWLSETPLIAASRMNKKSLERHVNWVRLKDKATSVEFRVLNTHLALEQMLREHQAQIIVQETAQYGKDFPQIITGDFNAQASSPEIQLMKKAGWQDSYMTANPPESLLKMRKIDYIFTRGAIKPLASSWITDTEDGGRPSDHYFISADLTFPNTKK